LDPGWDFVLRISIDANQILFKKQLIDAVAANITGIGNRNRTDPNNTGSWLHYGTSLGSTIVQNIQLILSNVHIRYEDKKTLSTPFACGFRIQWVTVQTTNDAWV
jgi:hypothetical protein